MIDRHPAEITVMQFTGHSLPVRQSMSVPWEFFTSSHFISQFPPTRYPLITAIRMSHFLQVHHLGIAFLDGSKAKMQHWYSHQMIIKGIGGIEIRGLAVNIKTATTWRCARILRRVLET